MAAMDGLMSDIMSVALGKSFKPEVDPHHCHGHAFIADELVARDWTPESLMELDADEMSTCSSPFNDSVSASPTGSSYMRGNFYHLSPPPSILPLQYESCEKPCIKLSFSVDAILGNHQSSSALVTVPSMDSNISSRTVPFDVNDWNMFQRYRSVHWQQTTSQLEIGTLYWCHSCHELCGNEAAAMLHQREHVAYGDRCALKHDLHIRYGYVSVLQMTSHAKRLKCGLCERIVTHQFLYRHMHAHHCHECHVCGLEMPSIVKLQEHMRVHAEVTSVSCDQCKRRFPNMRHLAFHKSCAHRT
ncbi:zinc finger protein 600-like isoform X3 [Dreissena polymorpha]|uniref:zinc finger protein 600-like isoform X3 n=1 Tax=Dreissena polymorpha TaxID=45954 RepID=UPI0022653A33|nr:zinc finger protein 600-like isoform X3 [Dreissena polymorpha]